MALLLGVGHPVKLVLRRLIEHRFELFRRVTSLGRVEVNADEPPLVREGLAQGLGGRLGTQVSEEIATSTPLFTWGRRAGTRSWVKSVNRRPRLLMRVPRLN
jgi:hypothetical protein